MIQVYLHSYGLLPPWPVEEPALKLWHVVIMGCMQHLGLQCLLASSLVTLAWPYMLHGPALPDSKMLCVIYWSAGSTEPSTVAATWGLLQLSIGLRAWRGARLQQGLDPWCARHGLTVCTLTSSVPIFLVCDSLRALSLQFAGIPCS